MRGLNRQYTKAILIKIRYYNRKKTLKSSSLPPPPQAILIKIRYYNRKKTFKSSSLSPSPPPKKKQQQQQHGVAPLPSFLMLKGPVILLFPLYYYK